MYRNFNVKNECFIIDRGPQKFPAGARTRLGGADILPLIQSHLSDVTNLVELYEQTAHDVLFTCRAHYT